MAKLEIYGEIGWDVDAGDIISQLKKIRNDEALEIRIDSVGGSVFDGFSILNALSRHQGEKKVFIDGKALSIASVIMCAGDKVTLVDNGWIMVHNPAMVLTGGEAEDLRKDAELLDKIQESIILTYQKKTGKTRDEIVSMMNAETWFNAEEAKEAGFVDEVSEAANMINFPDLSKYKNIPQELSISAGYSEIVKKIEDRKKRGKPMSFFQKIKTRFPDIPEDKARVIYAMAINQDEAVPETKEACEAKEGWFWDEQEGVCKKKPVETENQDEAVPETKEACEAKEGWFWDEQEGVCKKKPAETENQDDPNQPQALFQSLSKQLKHTNALMTGLVKDMADEIWESALAGYSFPPPIINDLKALVNYQSFMQNNVFQKAAFKNAVKAKVIGYAEAMAVNIEPEGINALGGETSALSYKDAKRQAKEHLAKLRA